MRKDLQLGAAARGAPCASAHVRIPNTRLDVAAAARRARWDDVRTRRAQGQTITVIARNLGMARNTVRRLLATPDPPRNRVLHPRPGGLTSPSLQPYVAYLQDRWQEGERNLSRLYREIAAKGFAGSRSLLAQALLARRPPLPPRMRRLSVRWLCLRPPDQLDGTDIAALDAWLIAARASDLTPFVSVANWIATDRAAVEAALTTPWSTGPVEWHVHRVKLLKRQHYGRAKLDLLRARVLAA